MTIQDTDIADNVTPLRLAKTKRADNTAALRQRRSRAKRTRGATVIRAANAQIAQLEKPSEIKADVTVACRLAKPEPQLDDDGSDTHQPMNAAAAIATAAKPAT